MSLDEPEGGAQKRCDLCGRLGPIAKSYLLLSRRINAADDSPAWQRQGVNLPPEEQEFQGHEFAACAKCERRKLYIWIVAALGVSLFVPIVWKHAGLGFAYLFVFLAAMVVLARFTPVNQLLRKLRRVRRAEFPELLKSKRIAYQFLTPGALAIQHAEARRSAPSPGGPHSGGDHRYVCCRCGQVLKELGVPAVIQVVQSYGSVVDIGTERVPEEVKKDPFLYQGLFCRTCGKAFCPACAGQQAERCPACGAAPLQPAYRPFLEGAMRS